MRISLGSWAFSFGPYSEQAIPFEQVARRLAAAGYDGIEISGFPPHVTLDDYPGKESRRALVRLLGDLNLAVSGYAADLTGVNPTAAAHHGSYLELFERNLELCAEIGSPRIRVDSGAAPGSIPDAEYDSAFARLAELWRQAAEIARRSAIGVVWEFEPGFAFNKPSEVVAMVDRVGDENFQVLFDTAHAYMCGVAGARQHGASEALDGGIGEFLCLLEGKIGHIHLVDSDGTLYGDETSTHRPFGEGIIDFRAIGPQLLAVAGVEWWCVDLSFWPAAWERVESSLVFARKLAGH